MSTHVSCLSLVNSPAGLHTVRSRPPTDIHRGVETGMFNNSVLFSFLPYPIWNQFFPSLLKQVHISFTYEGNVKNVYDSNDLLSS